jgi:hypothetical protein
MFGDLHTRDFMHISDQEYRKLRTKAIERRGDAAWVVPSLIGVAGAGFWMLTAVALNELYGTLTGLSQAAVNAGGMVNIQVSRGWWGANAVVAVLICIAAYSLTRWILIARTIRLLINRSACPFCEFALFGLQVGPDNGVTCPECGERVYLHEHRIRREDVQALKPLPAVSPIAR